MRPAPPPLQELKEMCDRRRWPQPSFSYSTDANGSHVCILDLPNANVVHLNSGPQQSKKRAKEEAALMVLRQLNALGLR